MEEAISLLKVSLEEEEFIKQTRTVLRILQNILNEPEKEKFRTIQGGCKFLKQNNGVSKLLEAIGFTKGEGGNENSNPEDYVLGSDFEDSLAEKKQEIVRARRSVNTVMGWDVPASCLKFSLVQGKGKFGDIFIGRMDDRNVRVKIMRPDCNKDAKEAFDRELDILSKVQHPYVVQLCGVTLTSEPTSLILEHMPQCLLDVLHSKDVSEQDVLRYSQQLASAMQYLHQREILHCDLAARNLLLARDGTLRLSEFGMSRWAGTAQCHLTLSVSQSLNVRWTAPEVLSEHTFTKQSDIWSYGIVLYELATGGSVPYATFSNSEVQLKVNGGYQLPQPQGCHEALYTLMRHCCAREPTRRPQFADIIKTHLESLAAKLASGDVKVNSTVEEEQPTRSISQQSSKSSSKKVKVKEPSYQSVAGKGGGLVCIYTAFLSPFHRRVVVVCSRKSTVGEAISIALAKCGKHDHDPKNHRLVLVSGPASGSPAHYLDSEDRLMSVKGEATPTSMFVLCVNMPGQAPLELINSVRLNPAYGSSFLSGTRGYLVHRDVGKRSWYVLDGSTLLCYAEEEDEGVKQFETYLDFKTCSVEPVAKGKSHLFKVRTSAGSQYTFLATSKDDMYQWVESISSSSTLDPSPMLLNTGEGAVIQTGFMSVQEFAHNGSGEGENSLSSRKLLIQRRLGNDSTYAGTFSAVDYGEHWTVLRSSGLVQCVLKGKPETLFHLSKCRMVKVHNPKEMREGVEYFIQIDTPESVLVLKAALPTEHSDWVLSIEQMLQKLDRLKLIEGHRKRESGYVALKRLLLTGTGSMVGQSSLTSSPLYCLPKIVDDMEDIYSAPKPSPLLSGNGQRGRRSKLLQKPSSLTIAEAVAQEQNEGEKTISEDNIVPLPSRDCGPPPVPLRNNEPPPPLPPKGITTIASSSSPLASTMSMGSGSDPDADDDYVMMQPSVPPSPSGSMQYSSSLYRGRSASQSPTQPITIPNRRSSKRSTLLRKDSDSSSCAPSPTGSAMRSLQEDTELILNNVPRGSLSSPFSLQRQCSNQSLASVSSSSYFNSTTSITPPSLPPRNDLKSSSGYNSPAAMLNHSPGIHRSQSCINRPFQAVMGMSTGSFGVGEDSSKSDGMTMAEVKHLKQQYEAHRHPVSRAGSMGRQASFNSEGYASNQSSSESLIELPPGWARGYCDTSCKYFFFNTATGESTWSLQDVFQHQGSTGVKPGSGWKTARTEKGQAYYYNEQTQQTTWNIQDTYT